MLNIDADVSKFDEGIWEDFDGSSFLIAHISNARFQRALAKYQLPHRRKIQEGTIDPEVNKQIVAKAMSEAILLDWKKVVKADKSPVDYTPDLGYKALMRDPDFRDFVTEVAMSTAKFKAEEVEELGKP